MYYVYILQSKLNSELYTGSSNDLKKRFQKHNDGKVTSTKRYKPWKLIYYEAYQTEKLARIREKRLKYNGNAMRELRKRIGLGLPRTTFKPSKSGAGFTLIEVLLYVASVGIVILAASILLTIMVKSRVKNVAIAEVEQQGLYVMGLITQTVRNSSGINSPATGSSGSSLSVAMRQAAKNPTVFDVSSQVFRITEGAASPVNITSSRVSVSGVTFTNLSRSNTPGTIQAQFTITYVNLSGLNEYNYSKTFYGSGTLK